MRSTLQSLRARRGQTEKGFTLIELLVVVVIIGVLIAIAIPLYLNYQKSSHDKAADSDARNAVVAMENCYTSNGSYTAPAAAVTGGTTGASADLGTCSDKVNVSPGSSLTITVNAAGDGYKIDAFNSNGHANTHFCYDSTTGGSVTKKASC